MKRAGGDARVARRRERRAARQELRELALSREPLTNLHDYYSTSHPGNPLGRGYPIGSPLRRDEETHREAWKRVLRGDPCAYCGRLPFPCRHHGGEAGTVDHVDPQSGRRPAGGLHSWTNYTGACGRCNCAKSDVSLLVWLARRPLAATIERPGGNRVGGRPS